MTQNTYWTSDTHFSHANVIKYCNRPFRNVDEMNATLIENWNNTVGKNDVIYHLGDFAFCSDNEANYIIKQLNGEKYLIKGNHDFGKRYEGFKGIYDLREVKRNVNGKGLSIVMCHYAMRVWNKSHHGSIMLYGHSHGELEGNTQSLDVGVDAWNYTPVSIDQILKKMATLPKYDGVHH